MYTQKQLSDAVASFLANNPSDIAEAIELAGTVSEDIGVKPIYVHHITLTLDSSAGRVSVMILNNSSTSFDAGSFVTYLNSISVDESGYARFLTSGGIVVEGTLYPALALLKRAVGSRYGFVGVASDGTTKVIDYADNATLTANISTLSDYCFKIN